ncbi:MAG TPA: methyltransferase domain-containing protein, partial [Ignavibacteriaceae bacterium]|nr:methyltransferase domain-containing protein [Ignavibacteriaceae bacterium]
LNSDAETYYKVHSKRYEFLLSQVKKIRNHFPQRSLRILDIGPSIFTKLLEKSFPDDLILMLGLGHESSRGGHLPLNMELDPVRFYSFNLNNSQVKEKWIKLPESDIVIMAEVIEHLYTSPALVLEFLKTCIKSGGYLIIQTPNAAALRNRIALLLGRNPFEMIRTNADNPGHFREYTMKELINFAEKTGFEVCRSAYISYFNPRNRPEKFYIFLTNIFPKSFRTGLTVILMKK